jgi:hypothetical protein
LFGPLASWNYHYQNQALAGYTNFYYGVEKDSGVDDFYNTLVHGDACGPDDNVYNNGNNYLKHKVR